ncbi:MAG: hypothetical protein J6X16_01030 [Bacteroidales bacterium]|nr:hypothetical protein [Bacteroidales bacterium]
MKKIYILLISLVWWTALLGQSYHIGDLYTAPDGSKGIVFYLFPDGSGGWAVALNDASSGCAWGNGTDVPGIPNYLYNYSQMTRDTAGYSRTLTLRSYQNNNPNYAAGVVDFAHGWYLPSTGQLSVLFGELPRISNALVNAGGTDLAEAYYWCAAEYIEGVSWAVDFRGPQSSGSMGGFCSLGHQDLCSVRAVRTFKNTENHGVNYLWNTGDTTFAVTVNPTQTTTYSVVASTTDGQSDTAEYTIVVNAASISEFDVATSTPYVWNDITYSQSGDYTEIYTNLSGCDSIVTLHLNIISSLTASITATADTICQGDSVMLWTDVSVSSISPVLHVPLVAVGDILCTDNSIVKPADYANSGKSAMGIVFYVNNTGEHGWAVHLQNQSTSVVWGGNGTDISALPTYSYTPDAVMDMDGYNNTQIIRSAGDANTYRAAYRVDFTNGWYIPAVGQLRLLYAEIVTINASLQIVGGVLFSMNSGFWYWSSTEQGRDYVYLVSGSGALTSGNKNDSFMVRSVRSF